MKQHIDIEQLNELTEEQKIELRNWWKPAEGDWFTTGTKEFIVNKLMLEREYKHCLEDTLPLLSIGQMIEFLDNNFLHINRIQIDNKIGWQIEKSWDDLSGNVRQLSKSNLELCDALWEAVKYILQDKIK